MMRAKKSVSPTCSIVNEVGACSYVTPLSISDCHLRRSSDFALSTVATSENETSPLKLALNGFSAATAR